MTDKATPAHVREEHESTLRLQADDVQSEAYELSEPLNDSLLRAAGSDVDSQRSILSKVGGGARAQLLTHLQQTVGNQQVQHLMNAPHSSSADVSVQRQSEEEDLMSYMHADNLPSVDLSGVSQAWDTASGGVSGAVGAWRGGVQGAISGGLGAAADAGNALWGGASGAVSSLVSGAEGAGSALWGGATGAVSSASSGLDQILSGDVLGGLSTGVGGAAGSLWGGATGAVDAASSGLGGALGAWGGGVRGAIGSGVQGVQNIGSSLLGGAQGAASSIGGAASSLWEQATGSPVPTLNPEDLWM